ncbi:MAG: histidine phosphatase family protein [Eubacteriales bacterium]|nr:histidine phosphatase family protein [Eubacteriales bacterium]
MRIWLTRHGQTNLNRRKEMQGRTDEPLNETGIRQAEKARQKIGEIRFDAVYASTLDRAVTTASIIGDVPKEQVKQDPRIIEVDFGRYERKKYYGMGPAMTLFWALPEVIPEPKTVEPIPELVERSRSFLADLERWGQENGYENVLIACHGGIMRVLSGCLEGRQRGFRWRPKPRNCEIRVYEPADSHYRMVRDIIDGES